jgi:hypothetical protein
LDDLLGIWLARTVKLMGFSLGTPQLRLPAPWPQLPCQGVGEFASLVAISPPPSGGGLHGDSCSPYLAPPIPGGSLGHASGPLWRRTGSRVASFWLLEPEAPVFEDEFMEHLTQNLILPPPPHRNPHHPRRQNDLKPFSRREIMERETGFEPATNSLEGCDSTPELLPR